MSLDAYRRQVAWANKKDRRGDLYLRESVCLHAYTDQVMFIKLDTFFIETDSEAVIHPPKSDWYEVDGQTTLTKEKSPSYQQYADSGDFSFELWLEKSSLGRILFR